jgi:hypothetical protein
MSQFHPFVVVLLTIILYLQINFSDSCLIGSVDCVEGNTKPGAKFYGVITDIYNNTIDVHHQRTPKNLKDH